MVVTESTAVKTIEECFETLTVLTGIRLENQTPVSVVSIQNESDCAERIFDELEFVTSSIEAIFFNMSQY